MSNIQLSHFGFPIGKEDLCHFMNNYLHISGRKVEECKVFPGPDLIKSFLRRYPELTNKFVSNIKKAQANDNEEIFEENIFNILPKPYKMYHQVTCNYDKTNLTDIPGSKKCLVKRGSKYPTHIRNTSKTSISIMISVNATGEILPPFVVYKATNLWSTWCVGGPKGARYFSTKSGCFDRIAFEEWFFSIVLPCFKKKLGVKVLLGDKLSSHISPKVIATCEENEIKFVCLPPHSTHITQSLDKAFFKPLKTA